MNTFVFAVVLFAATNVLGQNPYEYVDDDLIQRVGQIVFEYDQKVAASRSAGGSVGSNVPASRSVNEVSGGYQVGRPERVARVTNFDRVNNVPQQQQQVRSQPQYNHVPQQQQQVRSQPQYNNVQQQSYVQQQPQQRNHYQVNRNQYQRQLAAPVQAPQQNYYQAPRPVARTYQAPAQYNYQEPQVVQQQQPKNAGFSAYTLSQPEVVQRVAEFHFTDGQESGDNFDSYKSGVSGVQRNGGFRLA